MHLRDTPVEYGVHTLRHGGYKANQGSDKRPPLLLTDVRRERLLGPADLHSAALGVQFKTNRVLSARRA